jgi:hypothetical protein
MSTLFSGVFNHKNDINHVQYCNNAVSSNRPPKFSNHQEEKQSPYIPKRKEYNAYFADSLYVFILHELE